MTKGGSPGAEPREEARVVEVRVPRRVEEALEFLYREPFRNASLISLVERSATGGGVEIRVAEEDGIYGALVTSPGPEGTRSVGLDAASPEAAEALLRSLSVGERLQVGLHRAEVIPAMDRVCAATPTGVMLAFRSDGPWLRARCPSSARELTRKDERVVRHSADEPFLYSFQQATRGRASREESEVHTFGVIERGRLLARCLTTWGPMGIERQIGTVWSVFTDPSARQRGLGRAVVAAATAAILDSGRVARYFAFSDNVPSVRICQSLGYTQDHAVHYFWAQRRR